ncbi:MAG: SAM-dependent methyltransferase, partial [Mycobacteriaceae bacterium]
RIVANPPFVVGQALIEHTYRDSGLDLDGASKLMISTATGHLNPGGTASLLASWAHIKGQDWRSRVASWIPAHGVDAWIVQRDVADPELYVGTWIRDAGMDLQDPAVSEKAHRWLEHFSQSKVEGIGFGFVYLQKTDEASDVLAEDLHHSFEDPLGKEALEYFTRTDWLRNHNILQERFVVNPATALERIHVPNNTDNNFGWTEVACRLHRGNGPLWQHEIDELGVQLLAGMQPKGLPLQELITILAASHGIDRMELEAPTAELIHALIRHGLVLPA